MKYLVLLVVALLLAVAVLAVAVDDWLLLAAVLGLAAGIVWIWALEHRWPLRLRIQHLRWELELLSREADDTAAEMTDLWFATPGGDTEWRALNDYLADLYIKHRAVRLRIDDLVYRLGQDKY